MTDKPQRTLADLRQQHRLTQHELAVVSGVEYSTIAKLEIGMHTPRQSTLDRLAQVLGYEVLGVAYGWNRRK